MAEEEPGHGDAWAREVLRRAEKLARPGGGPLERIRRQLGRITRAVAAGERTPEQALEALEEVEEELEAHRADHGADGEPARQRLADRLLELIEELKEQIRRREGGDGRGGT